MHTYLDEHTIEELSQALSVYLASPAFEPQHFPYLTGRDKQAAEHYIQDYQERIASLTSLVEQAIHSFNHWTDQQKIALSTPITDQIPVYFYDFLISASFPHLPVQNQGWAEYRHPFSTLSVSRWSSAVSILSDLTLNASFNPNGPTVAYARLEKSAGLITYQPTANQWFNSGVTIIILSHLVPEIELVSYLNDQASLEQTYWFTNLITQELNLEQNTLIRGYFQANSERETVRQAIQTRFQASLEDLRDFYPLPLGPEMRQTVQDILKNKPVVLTYPKDNRELEALYQNMAALFPQVSLDPKP